MMQKHREKRTFFSVQTIAVDVALVANWCGSISSQFEKSTAEATVFVTTLHQVMDQAFVIKRVCWGR